MKKTCLILSGAGISADSGLKTFRDNGGLWEGHRIEDVATPEAFRRNPQLVLDFYNERRRQLAHAQPNPAHRALADLERTHRVLIVTQNVDDLHERAGSTHVLHLHGELNKLRSTHNENYIIDFHGEQTLDMTDPQGYPMRPHIVWFGESVPAIETAIDWAQQADIVLIIGTSLKVYPAAGLADCAPAHAAIYYIDPHPAPVAGVETIAASAAVGVPQIVARLQQNP